VKKTKNIPTQSENAFTLIEVVLALLILGLIVGAAIPVWQGFISSKNLDTAVRQVASDIREAQARAMAEEKYYGIDFDVTGNQYFVHRDTTTATLFDEANRIPWGKHGEVTITLPDEIIFNSSTTTNPITFNNLTYGEDRLVIRPNGYTNTMGSIYLQNEKGKERSLSVVTTGKVNIKE